MINDIYAALEKQLEKFNEEYNRYMETGTPESRDKALIAQGRMDGILYAIGYISSKRKTR